MMRKIIYNGIIVLLLLSMTGCGISNILPSPQVEIQPPDKEVEREEISSQPMLPKEGGQLRIPLLKPHVINPLFSKSKDFINFAGLIYEGLFTFGENLEPVPTLAESWEVSDEGKLWQIQLRKGVKWHDGREFTAQDVKYTFDLLFNETQGGGEGQEEGEISLYAKRLFNGRNIARVEPVINNPYAVDIILNEPAGRTMLEALTFPILPAGYGEQVLNMEDVSLLIGTGPYKVESGSMELGEEIKLTKNEGWWGPSKPYIDSIVVTIYKDMEESLEAFKEGKLDVVDTHVIFAESYGKSSQVQLYQYLTQNFSYIGVNHRSPGVLRDKGIREAIAYGINRKDIISRVYSNNVQAVDAPIPPDAWYYDSDLRVYDYQPSKAQQILRGAGWTNKNDDGILIKDDEGTELGFTINANMDNIMHKEALNIIAEQLGEIGIDVKIRLLPWDEYVEALEKGDFQAVFGEYYPDISTDLRYMFHSSEMPGGINSYIGYKSEELDQLLDRVAQIEETGEFEDTYKDIQKHLVEELPIISLYYRTSSLVTKERVHGIKAPRELMIFRDIAEWYLEP